MLRALLTLIVSVSLLLPPAWTSGLWFCQVQQSAHAEPCCDDGDCCVVLAADDEAGAPAVSATPSRAFVLPSFPSIRAWPLVASRPVSEVNRYRFGPPAVGPPLWLEVQALLL